MRKKTCNFARVIGFLIGIKKPPIVWQQSQNSIGKPFQLCSLFFLSSVCRPSCRYVNCPTAKTYLPDSSIFRILAERTGDGNFWVTLIKSGVVSKKINWLLIDCTKDGTEGGGKK